MAVFFSALTSIVLPILLVAGIGFILRRAQLITDARPLARAALYFFSPALVLNSIAHSKLSNDDFVALFVFMCAMTAILGVLGYMLARWLKFDRLLQSAFLLSVMFMNAGNIGLPFNQFAFGQAGLVRAAVCFVASAMLVQTVAIFIASRGRNSVRRSIAAVFKMPLVYGAVLGLVMNHWGWTLPESLARAVELASGATVPVMLVVLGLELGRVRLDKHLRPVVLATVLKLIVTPIIGIGLARLMNLQGLTHHVPILEISMPSAINAAVVAIEFDARPDFVTSVVFVSTLGSIVTLVVLVLLLGYTPG